MSNTEKMVFNYKKIEVLRHYFYIILLWSLSLFGVIGFIVLNFDIEGILIALSGFIFINVHWWLRLIKENNRPSFIVDANGFEIVKKGEERERVLWNEISEIKLVDYFDEQKKDGRPGFIVFYRNKEIKICEIIEDYVGCYNQFKRHGIKGTETEPFPYRAEDLNIYGEFKF